MKQILIFILCLNTSVWAQEEFHATRDLGSSNTPSSTSIMTERIKEAAKQYKSQKPIPRYAQFDYAFASSLEEFQNLNTYGIIYIAAFTQDVREYPLKKVYFKTGDKEIELQELTELKMTVSEKEIKDVFGEHRIDYYYLIPFAMTQIEGTLFIDWSLNRKEFKLLNFPNNVNLDFIKNQSIIPVKNKKLSTSSMTEFMKREFQININ